MRRCAAAAFYPLQRQFCLYAPCHPPKYTQCASDHVCPPFSTQRWGRPTAPARTTSRNGSWWSRSCSSRLTSLSRQLGNLENTKFPIKGGKCFLKSWNQNNQKHLPLQSKIITTILLKMFISGRYSFGLITLEIIIPRFRWTLTLRYSSERSKYEWVKANSCRLWYNMHVSVCLLANMLHVKYISYCRDRLKRVISFMSIVAVLLSCKTSLVKNSVVLNVWRKKLP